MGLLTRHPWHGPAIPAARDHRTRNSHLSVSSIAESAVPERTPAPGLRIRDARNKTFPPCPRRRGGLNPGPVVSTPQDRQTAPIWTAFLPRRPVPPILRGGNLLQVYGRRNSGGARV